MSTQKKVTNYQLFFSDKIESIRNNNTIASTDRVATIAGMWRALPETEKQYWSQAAKVKKLNGYQRYVQAQMPIIKVNQSIAPKDRFKEIAQLWKGLSTVEKQEWSNKIYY